MHRFLSAVARWAIYRTRVRLAIAIAVLAPGAFTGFLYIAPAAHASGYYFPIYADSSSSFCIDDPSNSTTPGTSLQLESNCGLQGDEWYVTSDSYGSGWSSIVLLNTSHGDLCIDDVDGQVNGAPIEIEGCNGSAEQAWKPQLCSSDGSGDTELVNPLGMAIDLYGDYHATYQPIVSWGAESSGPNAEMWDTAQLFNGAPGTVYCPLSSCPHAVAAAGGLVNPPAARAVSR